MSERIVEFAPTSTATTRETEPEVVAGIASGDTVPGQPLDIRTDEGFGYSRALLLLAAGLVLGFGAARWIGSRG